MNASYNFSTVRRHKIYNALRLIPRLIAIAMVIGACCYFSYNYFLHYPRERMQMSYTKYQRLEFAFTQYLKALYLTITAPEDNPRTTPLPVMELYVPAVDLAKVTRTMPPSDDVEVSGFLKFAGDSYRVKVKTRGDSINHWSFPQKSWRIKLRNKKKIWGVSTVNLTVPRMSSQLENWLGYELAGHAGFIVPRSQMVHFRINRKFDGIRLFVEQANDMFLQRRGIKHGTILVGDITTAQIYGGVRRPPLFENPQAWDISQDGATVTSPQLNRIAELAKEKNIFVLEKELPKVLHIGDYARFLAFLQIVATNHIDDTHNQKFYVDPTDNLLHPIVWDTVAYSYNTLPSFDNDTSRLSKMFFSVPRFREMKDRALWQLLKAELSTNNKLTILDTLLRNMTPDTLATPLKITARARGVFFLSNAEWKESINAIKKNMTTIDTTAIKSLATTDLSARIVPGTSEAKGRASHKLLLGVHSRAGALVKSVTLQWPGAERASRKLSALQRSADTIESAVKMKIQNDVVTLPLNDHLFSTRFITPSFGRGSKVFSSVYEYELTGGAVPEILSIEVANAVNDRAMVYRLDESLVPVEPVTSVWGSK